MSGGLVFESRPLPIPEIAENLVWSRSLLRAWLRPGSVKLLSMPVEIAPEPASRRRKRR